MMQLKRPYLLFLGDVEDEGFAKTAFGLAEWATESCAAQLRLPGCTIDLGLPNLSIAEAVEKKCVKSLVIGVAPVGGRMKDEWISVLHSAASFGLDIVSGLHSRLSDISGLASIAEMKGAQLIDIRTPPTELPIGEGIKRSGKRLLTVGTDCAVGKKYTALAIARAMKARGMKASFRATGQTGIMIAGSGVPIDAVVADFVAGAAEALSPTNSDEHWDVVEGQGSLFHPAYAAVSLGLLHGSQPDAIVLCWDPSRDHLLGFPEFPSPDLEECVQRNIEFGRLTNPNIKCIGVSVNTSKYSEREREEILTSTSEKLNVPAVDPIATGVDAIIDHVFAA